MDFIFFVTCVLFSRNMQLGFDRVLNFGLYEVLIKRFITMAADGLTLNML